MKQRVRTIIKRLTSRDALIYIFLALSAISCMFTYVLFSDIRALESSSRNVLSILYVDVVLILILCGLISNKVMRFWNNRHKKGSRLTLRLIAVFSGVSIFPTALMCIFSSVFFHNGLESWFNTRNQTVLKDSLKVAQSYLEEHKQATLLDAIALSRIIENNVDHEDMDEENLESNYKNLCNTLDDLCRLKGVSSAILVNSNNIVAHSKYSVDLHFLNITAQDFHSLNEVIFSEKNGKLITSNGVNHNVILAATCFKALTSKLKDKFFYLIVEKKIDAQVLLNADKTKQAYDEYRNLLNERESLEVAFILMFFIAGFLILILSIIMAVALSWKIVNPISNLINASENVIGGNWSVKVESDDTFGELKLLSDTFNRMIEQVHKQQKALKKINEQLDEKIKFTNSVLSGVSSGIIGLDGSYVYIWNKRAEELFGKAINFGENIYNMFPEIKGLIESISQENILMTKEYQHRRENEILLFSVKVMKIFSDDTCRYVVTFDDLTETVLSQRKAAWAEVARRVAHEVKNPLTPIQLSAERIKRKYGKQITEDVETFSKLIDVIVKQVGDIKRLIDEFNFFARLPEPKMKRCSMSEICSQAIFLMKSTAGDININFDQMTEEPFDVNGDDRLIHQCIVNLIKNALNALSTIDIENKSVWITLRSSSGEVYLDVEDNGPGLPKDKMESLATPYFSLLPKGTGLGLAIVKKIIQDHRGSISFGSSEHGGAKVTVVIPSFMWS
ncbi:MAG: HAMP domain-containing protein [Alphaproteobacteria bacterium]|nr:HAMP domain-containing protein [Alphaproteobacteria bacterium]